jgi:hypothetical protein
MRSRLVVVGLLVVAAIGATPISSRAACVFCKGGALSIDKPVDRGGGLSINKPLDKGGDLSIDKVYVPPKLRIGRVHGIAEIIIPVCWGSPQDCRGMKETDASKQVQNQTGTSYPYYITERFICKNRTTGQISGKECDVTEASATSCPEALSQIGSIDRSNDDPCTHCSGVDDPNEVWNGVPPQHVQGGSCTNW